jgi:hypothetical protein
MKAERSSTDLSLAIAIAIAIAITLTLALTSRGDLGSLEEFTVSL